MGYTKAIPHSLTVAGVLRYTITNLPLSVKLRYVMTQFKSKTQDQGTGSLMPGYYMVNENIPQHLVGRLCQIIEMLGLREAQEKATKDTVKEQIYDAFPWDKGARVLDGNLVEVILDVMEQENKHASENMMLSGFTGSYELTKTIK